MAQKLSAFFLLSFVLSGFSCNGFPRLSLPDGEPEIDWIGFLRVGNMRIFYHRIAKSFKSVALAGGLLEIFPKIVHVVEFIQVELDEAFQLVI